MGLFSVNFLSHHEQNSFTRWSQRPWTTLACLMNWAGLLGYPYWLLGQSSKYVCQICQLVITITFWKLITPSLSSIDEKLELKKDVVKRLKFVVITYHLTILKVNRIVMSASPFFFFPFLSFLSLSLFVNEFLSLFITPEFKPWLL